MVSHEKWTKLFEFSYCHLKLLGNQIKPFNQRRKKTPNDDHWVPNGNFVRKKQLRSRVFIVETKAKGKAPLANIRVYSEGGAPGRWSFQNVKKIHLKIAILSKDLEIFQK